MRLSAFLPILLFFGWSSYGLADASSPADVVDLQLRWHHQFQFAGYYAAVEKGFYREEGLEVRLHAGDKDHQPVSEVLAGRVQYAEGNSEVLYQRLLGKPLVALAAIFQHSPSVLLTRKDSGIRSAHDLIGKKVMLMNMTEDADFLTMFLGEGIDLSKIDIIPSSYDLEDLVSGKVDAFNSYLTNEPYYLKQRNIAYEVISPNSYRIDFYSDILVTTETELREHPKRVEALRRATLKGWRYAFDHQQEIIELLIEKYRVAKTREHLRFEAEEMRKLIFPDLIEIGHMNPGRWQHMADTFVDAGLIKPGYSLEGFIYDTTPKRLPDWALPAIIGVAIALAAVSVASYQLLRLNRRLRKAQGELLKSKRLLDEAQHIARLGSWEWNLINQKVIWSDVAAEIYAPENPSIEPSFEIFQHSVHPDDYDKVMAAIESALDQNAPYDIEHRVLSNLNGERYVHAQGRVIRVAEGKAVRFVGTVQDITERKRLEAELKWQAHIDYLTGVSNRRHFMVKAELELSRAIRYESSLSILMLDIDFFKQINDSHGHKIGDVVLKKLVEVCEHSLREVDVIGRLGGEEFAILLPETPLKEAFDVAERVRRAVDHAKVPLEHGLPLHFTVSIGLASLKSKDDNIDILLSLADKALYDAKNSGRNKVCVATLCVE